jgi:hypothetical protein
MSNLSGIGTPHVATKTMTIALYMLAYTTQYIPIMCRNDPELQLDHLLALLQWMQLFNLNYNEQTIIQYAESLREIRLNAATEGRPYRLAFTASESIGYDAELLHRCFTLVEACRKNGSLRAQGAESGAGTGSAPAVALISPSGEVAEAICNNFANSGSCRFGDKCRYAHVL